MTKAKLLLFVILTMLALAGDRARAQPYPSAPVKIISDSAPGSAPDAILRIVAERLNEAWGQQVVVMNQPGAGGSLAARAASRDRTVRPARGRRCASLSRRANTQSARLISDNALRH